MMPLYDSIGAAGELGRPPDPGTPTQPELSQLLGLVMRTDSTGS